MSHVLGVDLGTTYTAAAVGRDGRVEMLNLGANSTAIPSVVHFGESGDIAVGDAAVRWGLTDPERVVTDYKRRLGDPAPIVVGGTPMAAHLVGARLLSWVLDIATEREGERPDKVVVTHPANWGGYKREYFAHLLEAADVEKAETITEPEAAAIAYAANNRIELGEVVPVYDLGGGTFDVAILRRTAGGFELVGNPYGSEQLGGIDFDAAVFDFVLGQLDLSLDELDADDPAVTGAVHQLRQDVVQAKVALSSEPEAVVGVLIPGRVGRVRITRGEFEALVHPLLEETVLSVGRALRAAQLESEQLGRVLLVGGSSRIPLVAQMVMAAFGRPIALDADPKNLIATGAAHFGLGTIIDATPGPSSAEVVPMPAGPTEHRGENFEAVQLGSDGPVQRRAALPVESEEAPLASSETRLPLGFIVFDDGSTFMIDDDYVIGRDAATAPRVQSGEARPLILVDQDASVSRVHAELSIDSDTVRICDRGSTNGTYLWEAHDQRWEQLTAEVAVPLEPLTKVAIGQRTFVFEPIG